MRPANDIFTPTKRMRSFDAVVEQIRDAVLDGKVAVGERLPNERELCAAFGVSRSTLREALRALEALGIVEVRPGAAGGIYTSQPHGEPIVRALELLMHFSEATAHDLAEFRVSFEGETAYSAAQRATREEIAALQEIADEFAAYAADESVPWPVLAEVDVRFHNAMAQSSHNHVRVAMMLGIGRSLLRHSTALEPLMSVPDRVRIARELAAITSAVTVRNKSLARTRMRRHVKRSSVLQLWIVERRDRRALTVARRGVA